MGWNKDCSCWQEILWNNTEMTETSADKPYACVCIHNMHAFCPCMMQVFARNSKLLIVWRDGWNYSPPSAVVCSILCSFFSFFFSASCATSFFLSFFCFLPVSPPHFTSESSSCFCFKSNPFPFIPLPYFDAVMLESVMQKVLYAATNGRCVCQRGRVCVHVISPPAALRNNCPQCFLCLVMACCYLPPRCAKRKWLSNVHGFPWLLKPDSAAMNGVSSTALDIPANLYFH